MDQVADHAVVLGGGMAGLLAAQVLARHVRRVTVVDRDRFPESGRHRRGVPQDRHAHALLARGRQTIEALFPDTTSELVAQGAGIGDIGRVGSFVLAGHRVCPVEVGLQMLTVSRPLLEGHLRARLGTRPNVQIRSGVGVHGLDVDRRANAVTGVRLLPQVNDSAAERLRTDLVVDATGRGSRLPQWLEETGHAAPDVEESGLEVIYTSARFPRHPSDRGLMRLVFGAPPDDLRGGAALAVEGEQWLVTLAGLGGEQAPRRRDGFVDFAASLSVDDLHDLVGDREPVSDFLRYRYPTGRRHHYERLRDLPHGLVITGDSLCSFNPVYGQGMTVAALQAVALDACLQAGTDDIGHRFLHAVGPVVDDAWELAAGEDRRFLPQIGPPRSWRQRLEERYRSRVQAATAVDPTIARRYHEVMGMVRRPTALASPAIATRVLLGTARPARS